MSIPGGLVPLLALLAAFFGFIAGVATIRSREIAWSEDRTLRGTQAALAGWLMCVGFTAMAAVKLWLLLHGV